MPTCGDCENFRGLGVSNPLAGFCNAMPTGERTYKVVKMRDDAVKCDKFIPVTRIVTDSAQSGHMVDFHIRTYKDYELEKIDVNVDPEKLKDEKAWG